VCPLSVTQHLLGTLKHTSDASFLSSGMIDLHGIMIDLAGCVLERWEIA